MIAFIHLKTVNFSLRMVPMIKQILLLVTCLLFTSSLRAQEYVAIVPVMGDAIEKDKSHSVTGDFIRKYNRAAEHKAIEQKKMDRILKDAKYEWNASFSELSNALAIARLLSVPYVITSTFQKENNGFKAEIKIFDLQEQKYTKKIVGLGTRRLNKKRSLENLGNGI